LVDYSRIKEVNSHAELIEKAQGASIGTAFLVKTDFVFSFGPYGSVQAGDWLISLRADAEIYKHFNHITRQPPITILDKYYYPDDSRTWNKTIWQKVVENGEEKYIFITDLNLL
jgi:hypothetical protein